MPKNSGLTGLDAGRAASQKNIDEQSPPRAAEISAPCRYPPFLACVLRSSLLPTLPTVVRNNKSGKNRPTIQRLLIKKLAASIPEFANRGQSDVSGLQFVFIPQLKKRSRRWRKQQHFGLFLGKLR